MIQNETLKRIQIVIYAAVPDGEQDRNVLSKILRNDQHQLLDLAEISDATKESVTKDSSERCEVFNSSPDRVSTWIDRYPHDYLDTAVVLSTKQLQKWQQEFTRLYDLHTSENHLSEDDLKKLAVLQSLSDLNDVIESGKGSVKVPESVRTLLSFNPHDADKIGFDTPQSPLAWMGIDYWHIIGAMAEHELTTAINKAGNSLLESKATAT